MHARKLPRISESSFEPNRWMNIALYNDTSESTSKVTKNHLDSEPSFDYGNGTSASTSKVTKNHMDSEPSFDYGNGTSGSTSKVTYEPHYRRRVSSSERGTNMLLNKLEIIPGQFCRSKCYI